MSKKLCNPKRGEVWFANFPYEEDPNTVSNRPVIVLEENDNTVGVLSIKVTKHDKRDEWDYDIVYWVEAKLRLKSTARISKAMYLNLSAFTNKIGDLHIDDLNTVDNLFNEYLKTLI